MSGDITYAQLWNKLNSQHEYQKKSLQQIRNHKSILMQWMNVFGKTWNDEAREFSSFKDNFAFFVRLKKYTLKSIASRRYWLNNFAKIYLTYNTQILPASFHDRFRHLIRKANLSQGQVSAIVGASPATVTEDNFRWLSEADQMKIINTINEIDRPIFLWLKYHYRRPSEGCALFKTDYDPIRNEFTVQRTFSARQLVPYTKTDAIHHVPCADEFTHVARRMLNQNSNSTFMFVNPRGRSDGSHYTDESLNNLWDAACETVGISISLYEGLKHSSCSQYINEKGGHDAELQMVADFADIKTVRKYRRVGVERKRQLMRKGRENVIEMRKASED